MTLSPQFTLIVLNWNARPYLDACLSSVLHQQERSFQVWLVDNHSSDGSVAWVQQQYPQVRILALPRNFGFAGGNNAALRQIDTPFAVLLNPDVVLAPDFLTGIRQAFAAAPNIGVVGAKLFYPDGRLQHLGGLIHKPLGLAGHVGHLETDAGQYETVQEATYVIGAAAAVRREVLEQVGYLDEGYFLYYEDADWCERIRRAGWRVVVAPQARLVHHESVLTGKDSLNYYRNFHRGRWRYILKHFDPATLRHETLPAEAIWLAERSIKEQHAAASAYLHILAALPAILQARERDGATPLTESDRQQIIPALQELYLQAWQYRPFAEAESLLQQQAALAEPRPQPFHSNLPVFGPFIVALRSAWNQIETVPYLQPIHEQQNEINQMITALSQQYLALVHTVADGNQRHARQQLAIRQQLHVLRQQIQEAQYQLHQLAQRVEKLT